MYQEILDLFQTKGHTKYSLENDEGYCLLGARNKVMYGTSLQDDLTSANAHGAQGLERLCEFLGFEGNNHQKGVLLYAWNDHTARVEVEDILAKMAEMEQPVIPDNPLLNMCAKAAEKDKLRRVTRAID